LYKLAHEDVTGLVTVVYNMRASRLDNLLVVEVASPVSLKLQSMHCLELDTTLILANASVNTEIRNMIIGQEYMN
jgi:hypothetical protein